MHGADHPQSPPKAAKSWQKHPIKSDSEQAEHPRCKAKFTLMLLATQRPQRAHAPGWPMLSKRCDCAICPPCGGSADRSADCSIPRYTEVEAVPTPLSVLPKVNYSDSALAHLTSGPQNLREPLCYFPHLRVLRLNAPPKVNPTTFVLQLQPVVGPSGPKRPTNLLDCSASSKGPRIRLCDPIGDPLVPVILSVEFSERLETATAMIIGFARGLGGTLSLGTLEAGHYRSCLTGKHDAAQARWP
jgi:hypothetical protein